MKITYIISTISTKNEGNGGHYYSLLSTASSIQKNHEIKIINIGTQESLALNSSKIDIINILDRKLNNYKLLKKLVDIVKKDQPDVLHAFDHLAYFYARIVSIIFKIPVILTKCGGRNPKYYYPFCKYLINYSLENQAYFDQHKKFKDAQMYVIPNRVSTFSSDYERISTLRAKYHLNNYDYIFLRITRIGVRYKQSISSLINLLHICRKNHVNACVLLIGSVEDSKVLDDIIRKGGKHFFIEKNPHFTQNAKELIDIADVVLGTGRSFMEAALKNKIMLAPLKSEKLPVLVDASNFNGIFKTNFSERGHLNEYNSDENFNKFISILKQGTKQDEFIYDMSNIYNENFNIDQKLRLYNKIYKELKLSNKGYYFDVFLNYLFIMKKYLKEIPRYKN